MCKLVSICLHFLILANVSWSIADCWYIYKTISLSHIGEQPKSMGPIFAFGYGELLLTSSLANLHLEPKESPSLSSGTKFKGASGRGLITPPPTLKICYFTGQNRSTIHFCRATHCTLDHWSTTVTKNKRRSQIRNFCREGSDTP